MKTFKIRIFSTYETVGKFEKRFPTLAAAVSFAQGMIRGTSLQFDVCRVCG